MFDEVYIKIVGVARYAQMFLHHLSEWGALTANQNKVESSNLIPEKKKRETKQNSSVLKSSI